MVNSTEHILYQYHTHIPSEHIVNGIRFPLEIHLVHRTPDGSRIAVISLLYTYGKRDHIFEKVLDMISSLKEKGGTLGSSLDMTDLKISGKAYYRYLGSLTTPPCTEGVVWTVLKKKIYTVASLPLNKRDGMYHKPSCSLSTLATQNSLPMMFNFYDSICPQVEPVVCNVVSTFISSDVTLGPALLCLHFHDCMTRGCDGSILLSSTDGGKTQLEKAASVSLGLRGFNVIEAIKAQLEKECPGKVSCADIVALAARDVSTMIGGPFCGQPIG